MKTKKGKSDFIGTVLIGTSVVLLWRGAWGLFDILLFPNNELLSSTVSVILGVAILLFARRYFQNNS